MNLKSMGHFSGQIKFYKLNSTCPCPLPYDDGFKFALVKKSETILQACCKTTKPTFPEGPLSPERLGQVSRAKLRTHAEAMSI